MSEQNYNLVIYGGNPAGIACAVRAAREGLIVLLVNHTPHIGGLACQWLGHLGHVLRGLALTHLQ